MRQGLAVGQEREHIFLTGDSEVARHYAELRCAETGVRTAAIVHVRLPTRRRLVLQPSLVLRPLPWMTTLPLSSREYVTDRAIEPRHVEGVDEWHVPQLDDPDALKVFERENLRFEATFADPFEPDRPKARYGLLAQAIPDVWALVDAVPPSDERRALAVAAAGVRLVEAGLPPDAGALSEVDPAVVLAFALLEAAWQADLAERLVGEYLRFTREQRDRLFAAFVARGWPIAPADPTIGACLDADALACGRFGDELATRHGRALAANPVRIPGPDDCDWPWIYERYHLLAGPTAAARAAFRGPTLRSLGLV
jgi:hypothetical protein